MGDMESEKLFEISLLADTFCSQHSFRLNLSKIKILYLIKKYEPAPASLLINKLGLIKTNLSSACLELEKNGYIISKKGKEDKRSRSYRITEEGKLILKEFLEDINKLLREENLGLDKALEILNKKI